MATKNTLGTPPRLSGDPTTATAEIQSYLQDIYNTLVLTNQYLTRGETSDFGRALMADADAAAARQRLGLRGAPVVLAKAVANNSATLDFVGVFNDTIYRRYTLEISGLIPSTNDVQALLRVGTGAGPTWQAGSGAYNNALLAWATASQGHPTATSTAMALSQQPGGGNGVTNPGSGLHGVVSFFKPQNTVFVKSFQIDMHQVTATPLVVAVRGSGIYAATTAITGLRLLFSTGNIASGEAYLIGHPE